MSKQTIADLAERLWQGDERIEHMHPTKMLMLGLEEFAERLAFVASFANVTAFDTDEGLVLVDVGGHLVGPLVHGAIRGWTQRPLHTAVCTHGHIDHIFGIALFDDEAARRGRRRPQVIAHDALLDRFARYRLTAGYNRLINARQFGVPLPTWPTDYRDPDVTYSARRELTIGG